jgi:hypothetical protein
MTELEELRESLPYWREPDCSCDYDDEYGGGRVAAYQTPEGSFLIVDEPSAWDSYPQPLALIASAEDAESRCASEAAARCQEPDYEGVASALGLTVEGASRLVREVADALTDLAHPWMYWVQPGSTGLLRSEANWLLGHMRQEGTWPRDAIPLPYSQYSRCGLVEAAAVIVDAVHEWRLMGEEAGAYGAETSA